MWMRVISLGSNNLQLYNDFMEYENLMNNEATIRYKVKRGCLQGRACHFEEKEE